LLAQFPGVPHCILGLSYASVFYALRKSKHLNDRSYWRCVSACECVCLPAFILPAGILTVFFSWLPLNHLCHCLAHTECKIAILDPERADLLQPLVGQLLKTKSFVVLDLSKHEKRRKFIPSLEELLDSYQDDQIFLPKTFIDPEDNATIIFTSGT